MIKFLKKYSEMYIDIFAMNTFSYIVALPIEIGISGMSWKEHLQVRIVALFLNTLVARPFGLWRTFIMRKTGVNSTSTFLRTYIVDTLIFLSFQFPLYVGNLVLGGADLDEIIKASLTVTIISGLLGRPYGVYLEWIRSKFGFELSYKTKYTVEV